MASARKSSFEVRVPASTANMGAGFDCLGLALEMYLSVRATVLSKRESLARVRGRGVRGTSELPSDPEENLIFRAMQAHRRSRQGFTLPRVRLAVQNQIPVAGGLGSSAAAAVAGIALGFAVTGRAISKDAALRYATEMEGHPDNVAAALLGGLVVTFTRPDGNRGRHKKTMAESDPADCGHAAREARNEKIARRSARQRAARRRGVQSAALRAIRRRARRSPLRFVVGCHARPAAPTSPPIADPRSGRGARGSAHARPAGHVALSGAGPSAIALATGLLRRNRKSHRALLRKTRHGARRSASWSPRRKRLDLHAEVRASEVVPVVGMFSCGWKILCNELHSSKSLGEDRSRKPTAARIYALRFR